MSPIRAAVPTAKALRERIAKGGSRNGGAASGNILGKNYLKQVDVILSHWSTGPEVLISTKRMDSSFGNNAANRVEESYGDAKNLRLRHPQAACGFVYGLRSTCWDQSIDKPNWLVDLRTKLGREEDAYHAVSLIVPEYSGPLPSADEAGADPNDEAPIDPSVLAKLEPLVEDDDGVDDAVVRQQLDRIPSVTLRDDLVPDEISPERFFTVMLSRVLDHTPINYHVIARELRDNPGMDLLVEQ